MSVAADSRYVNGELMVVTLPTGEPSRMLWQAELSLQGVQFYYHTVIQGERLDIIAGRAYGDPTKWWMIADMNPEVQWPADLVPGDLLRVPLASYDPETMQVAPFVMGDV